MAVGGTDQGGERWDRGDKGSTWPCNIAAPAAAMPVAFHMRGRYTIHEGTSLAAPYVAGVAALCLEIYPEMPLNDLDRILRKSGWRPSHDPHLGWGQVNARRAVELAIEERGTASVPDMAEIRRRVDRIAVEIAELQQMLADPSIIGATGPPL